MSAPNRGKIAANVVFGQPFRLIVRPDMNWPFQETAKP